MLRDPRSVLVSNAHYIAVDKGHRFHYLLGNKVSFDARIEILLRGSITHQLPPFSWTLSRYASWLGKADLVAKFEDLVGGQVAGHMNVRFKSFDNSAA